MSENTRIPASEVTLSAIAADVVSWNVDRQLSGGGVPGQVRTRSGFATATGSVSALSKPGTPWRPTVIPGGGVTIDARVDGGAPVERIFTGVSTATSAGSALAPVLDVSLADRTPKPVQINLDSGSLPFSSAYPIYENCFSIDSAARALGFKSSPDSAGAIASWPLHGTSLQNHSGASYQNYGVINWGSFGGECMAAGDARSVDISQPFTVESVVTYSGHYWNGGLGSSGVGLCRFSRFVSGAWGEIWLDMREEEISFGVFRPRLRMLTTAGGSTPVMTSWLPHDLPVGEKFYVEVVLSFESTSLITGRWRAAPLGEQVAWTSFTASSSFGADPYDRCNARGNETCGLAWATLRPGSEGDGLFLPTAIIDASGFNSHAPMIGVAGDAWSIAQEVADQTLGAAGIDEEGRFYFIGKDRLRGLGVQSKEIIGIDDLADIGWSISADGVADRVTVAYRPPDIYSTSGTGASTVWEADGVIEVRAGQTVNVRVDFVDMAVGYLEWFSQATTDPVNAEGSRWIAFSTREGSSPPVPSGALWVTPTSHSPTRASISILNRTSGTLWIRDVNGGPGLFLRSTSVARAGEPLQVSVGTDEGKALSPFTHEGGSGIQILDEALLLAGWLHANLSEPLPVLDGVSVVPDLSRRIGDVVTVYDPDLTAIRARCLIYGVHNSASASGIEQSLDLALLAVTVDDAMLWAESLVPTASSIGVLFDAVEAQSVIDGVPTVTIEDLIDYWETESVVVE